MSGLGLYPYSCKKVIELCFAPQSDLIAELNKQYRESKTPISLKYTQGDRDDTLARINVINNILITREKHGYGLSASKKSDSQSAK